MPKNVSVAKVASKFAKKAPLLSKRPNYGSVIVSLHLLVNFRAGRRSSLWVPPLHIPPNPNPFEPKN
jgi:hypothetical protein